MILTKWRSIGSASCIVLFIVLLLFSKQVSPVSSCMHCKNKTQVVKKNVVSRPRRQPVSRQRRVVQANNKRFSWPLRRDKFWISCFYGKKARGRLHAGLDLAAIRGTPIYASENGVVEVACNAGSYGNMILVRHDNNYKSRYAHLCRFAVRPGRHVRKGSLIGYVGNSGRTRGSNGGYHLHFEILHNGNPINPIRLLG
jgi:murein DD-endopeptidase MepM/ murein hydrolase activator NlpD